MKLPGPVMLDLKGLTIDAEEKEMLTHPACGGVILFARNIENPQQVGDLNRQIRELNPNLVLAVDQEGGRVQRLQQGGFTCLPPLRDIERQANSWTQALDRAFHHGRLMSLETLAVGFDISFAPVLDVATTTSRVIGDRAFHEQPHKIVDLAEAYIRGMNSSGMSATGKHFPGHGTVDADSHHEVPIDDRSFDEISAADLLPFRKLAKLLGGIMPAHVIYPQVDDLPAGFSPFWVTRVLREQLKFDGTVFSDDLSMAGAKTVGNFADRADAAITAGCDMVLVCNQPNEAGNVLEHLRNYKSTVSSQRLMSIKAKQQIHIGLAEIQKDARWQQSQEALVTYE